MMQVYWSRWRRYPGGPLQKWHLMTDDGMDSAMCGTKPGEYAVDGDRRHGEDIPERAVCRACRDKYPTLQKQTKGWSA